MEAQRAVEATGGPEEILEVFYDGFKKLYMSAPAVKTKPMISVRETLITAKGAAFAMGVCTNKSEPVAAITIAAWVIPLMAIDDFKEGMNVQWNVSKKVYKGVVNKINKKKKNKIEIMLDDGTTKDVNISKIKIID